jgi:Protein of unknown function (DUF2924)
MTAMNMLAETLVASNTVPIDHGRCTAPAEIATHLISAQTRTGNENSLSSELAFLATMTYSELHLAWRRLYRAVPPKKVSRDILELGVAWKLQENKLGGLGAAVKRQLAELARTMEARSDLAKPRAISPKPGSRLLRAWNGVTHEVQIVEDGFLWAGKMWRSLSAIAREITGTRWSGPRFFGLIASPPTDTADQELNVSDHE